MRHRRVVRFRRTAGPHDLVRRASQPAREPFPRLVQRPIRPVAEPVRARRIADETLRRFEPRLARGGGKRDASRCDRNTARDRSLRRPAAVDQDVRAGDEAGVLGAEIEGELSDLFELCPSGPAESSRGTAAFSSGFCISGAFISVSNTPGLMPLTVIFSGGQFERQRARETEQRGLARRVGRAARQRDVRS